MDINNNFNLKDLNLDNAKNLNLDKGTFLVLYKKYRDFVIPGLVILASIFILFFIVIPEINHYFAIKSTYDEESKKLNVLKNNYNFLSNLDEEKTKEDLDTLTKVFPTGKDFFGIITAISNVSSKTGVSVGDYSFSVGNLSKETGGIVQYPSIKIEMILTGNPTSFINFMNEFYRTAPLAEITKIESTSSKANITALFYYKPFPPENVSDDKSVSGLSAKNDQLLSELKEWNNLIAQDFSLIPGISLNISSSSSANLNASNSALPQTTSSSPF